MYAYVMRPETLPRGYWNFIVRTGPIHPTALEAVRDNIRGRPINLAKVNGFIASCGGQRLLSNALPRQVSLHDQSTRCFALCFARSSMMLSTVHFAGASMGAASLYCIGLPVRLESLYRQL